MPIEPEEGYICFSNEDPITKKTRYLDNIRNIMDNETLNEENIGEWKDVGQTLGSETFKDPFPFSVLGPVIVHEHFA